MAGKKGKESKRKPKYKMLSCVVYMYRLLWKCEKGLVWTGILSVPMHLAMSAVVLYTPAVILSYLQKADRFSTIALVILGLMLGKLLASLAGQILGEKTDMAEFHVLLRMIYQAKCQYLDRDFYLEYDPKVKALDNRADQAVGNNHTEAVHFPMDFSDMVALVLKFFLFGSVIYTLNPWIILLLVLGSCLDVPICAWERRRNYQTQERRDDLTKKLNYLSYNAGRQLKYGKDIRLYHLGNYLFLLEDKLFRELWKENEKVERRSLLVSLTGFFIVLIRDGAAYAFLISKAVAGEMDAARFVLYFAAISETMALVSGMTWRWSRICQGTLQVSDYRERLEVQGRLNRGEGIPVPQESFSVEFRNVTFRYPEGEKNILENISFKMEAGERIALVGLNGAGKTTLTKLMCGLLLPTEGEILLDGRNLYEYNRDELYTLFGLIPQNYNLLPFSIACNIACTNDADEMDRKKLAECIRLAGLEEKIAALPLGVDTPLNRQVNSDGTEFSGGEVQKLLLARLLYRRPKCMILDEPTAALDPIAEDRMYHRYNEFAAGVTSVFISHRLASTRFCHRILLLDGARIAETGTHEELMAAGGKYRELFEIQRKYYNNAQAHEA